MIEERKNGLSGWQPLVVGAVFVALFAALGGWQISRGLEKQATRDALSATGAYSTFFDGAELSPYEPIKATGRFDGEHQFLLDNITLNSRHGYYVLTPLELAPDEPLLLVNRGWIEKAGQNPGLSALADTIAVDDARVTVLGKAGALPRPGMRMGNAIAQAGRWPAIAVFPAQEDIEQALGRDVQPVVLLMDPDVENGFLRQWVPTEMGPARHFGYAFQWFAMAAVLSGLLVWNYRRRRTGYDF